MPSTITDVLNCYKCHRMLQMSSTVTNAFDCYKWHRLLQMASTVTNALDCYKWHRLLQMPSTVTNAIDYYRYPQLLQMPSTVTNGIDCYKCHRLLQMPSTVTNAIDCYKCHRLLQMPSNVTNNIDCYKCLRLLQMPWTVTNAIDCYKCHWLLQMLSTVWERENFVTGQERGRTSSPGAFWVFFKMHGLLHRRTTRHFEKYPESPGDEVGEGAWHFNHTDVTIQDGGAQELVVHLTTTAATFDKHWWKEKQSNNSVCDSYCQNVSRQCWSEFSAEDPIKLSN